MVRRAIKAVVDLAAPIIPGGEFSPRTKKAMSNLPYLTKSREADGPAQAEGCCGWVGCEAPL